MKVRRSISSFGASPGVLILHQGTMTSFRAHAPGEHLVRSSELIEPVGLAQRGTRRHLLGDVADLLAEGTGTVVNFGSLGGELSDIRLFAPRALTLKGVFLGQWMQQPADMRQADIALAQRLALEPQSLFEVAASYPPSRIGDAVAHVGRSGRNGVVLFEFTGPGGAAS
jgi:hypothetical protein